MSGLYTNLIVSSSFLNSQNVFMVIFCLRLSSRSNTLKYLFLIIELVTVYHLGSNNSNHPTPYMLSLDYDASFKCSPSPYFNLV